MAKDNLIFKPTYETSIYISSSGYFVIEQNNLKGGGYIELSPEQALRLRDFIEDKKEALMTIAEPE